MIDFNERAVPGVTSNFLMMEAMSRYNFASKYINSNSRVLDMASGVGYGTEMLGRKSKSTFGLDIDKESLVYAQQQFGSSASFVLGDALNTPFKDNYFDVIVAFEMIEHLHKPKVFLNEVHRILKKGGLLIISTPNSLVHSPTGKLMSVYHTKEYNYQELSQLLNSYFKKCEFFTQTKSVKAKDSWRSFMTSQTARRGFVGLDVLGLRKLISKQKRERIWKIVGNLFGRQKQEGLEMKDFPIKKHGAPAEYFIVVCKT